MPLTEKKIKRLLQQKPRRHHDEHGLNLEVRNPKSASWTFRFQRRGKERWMGMGSYDTFNLAEAREQVRHARQLLYLGKDPIEVREAERRAIALVEARTITFEDAAKLYFADQSDGWKNRKHREQFNSTLKTYVYPLLGKFPVADVDIDAVLTVLRQPMEDSTFWNARPETANRVRRRIENILSWATVQKYRKGDNPARWEGNLKEVLPARGKAKKVEHFAALPYADIASFMTVLQTRQGITARALEFTILTAARTGEVIGATWAEIDLAAKTWTIPGSRMKAGEQHRVPLTDQAIALLNALPREKDNPYVFIGRSSKLSDDVMNALLKRMGYGSTATTHGFRSTFRDWAGDCTNFPKDVAEMALAHAIENKTEAAYRRGTMFEKRRKLMETWGGFCMNSRIG